MRRFISLFALLITIHAVSLSQNGNFREIINKRMNLQSQIENGNKNALNALGVSYLEQNPTDYDKAFKLFQRAYDLGVENSAFNLGHCYYHGYGVNVDYTKALKLFLEDNGKTSGALYYLGALYFNGNGVAVDYDKAVDYFQKAKERGYTSSDIFLGICYAEGKGVEKDETRALSLLLPFAYKKNSEAQYNVAKIYMNLGNDEKALYWYGKVATQYSTASVIMGDIYKKEGNIVKAKDFYRQASDYGVAMGEYKLGEIIYDEGVKLESNGFDSDAREKYTEAFQLLKDASEDSETPIPAAMRLLHACYRYGRGTEENVTLAEKWKSEALKHKDKNTLELLEMEIKRKK